MTGQLHEIIHCPNCKEDVPKTLYCLNCGYPLYKLEKQKIEEKIGEEEQKILAKEEVDMSVEIEPIEPVSLIEVTPSGVEEETITDIKVDIETTVIEETPIQEIEDLEPEIETPIIEETPIQEIEDLEPEIETPIYVEDEPILETDLEKEPTRIMEPKIESPIYVGDEKPTQAELEEHEIAQPSVWEAEIEYEETSQDPIEPEIESEIFIPETREPYPMNEIQIEFVPDPLTKEVMESLAKNITLKIRLIKLLRENQVKEETFEKLFDNYVEQGKLWVSRRDETLGRLDTDIDRMEDELVSARKDFELLEIRKNIGDASDQEYSVKAPAFKWDIENLDNEIKNTRGGIQYVNNLKGLVPDDEIAELQSMAENEFSELNEIEGVSNETIARMKETLSDALKILEK